MVLLVISAIFLVIGAFIIARQFNALNHSRIVSGRVSELIPQISGKRKSTTYKIKASFVARDGLRYEYLSTWSSSHPGYSTGQPIRIYYDEKNPHENGIATFGGAFAVSIVLVLIGVLLGVAALLFALGPVVLERYYPITDEPRQLEAH